MIDRRGRWGSVGFVVAAMVAVAAVVVGAPDAAARAKKRKTGFRVAPVEGVEGDRQAVLDANLAFGLDVCRELAPDAEEGNLGFSPASMTGAMAMLLEAASGTTYTEIADAWHLALPRERVGPALQSVFAALPADRERQYRLEVANALWTRAALPFQQDFVTTLRTRFGAAARELDFEYDPERARRTINAWGRRRTHGRIPEAVPAGAVSGDTVFVLTNAVYFKARWKYPFRRQDTEPRAFHLLDGTTVEAQIMRVTAPLRHAELPGVHLVELPYRGDDASLLIVVPDDPTALPQVEATLTPETLAAWEDALPDETTSVDVLLPRFRLDPEKRLDLRRALSGLGVHAAFERYVADLSRAAGDPGGLFVAALLQSVFVAVDERGTEAAAVTAAGITSAPPTVAADRPFLFLLRHRPTGTLLFMGRVTDPR